MQGVEKKLVITRYEYENTNEWMDGWILSLKKRCLLECRMPFAPFRNYFHLKIVKLPRFSVLLFVSTENIQHSTTAYRHALWQLLLE